MDALGIPEAVLVGNSAGGTIALLTAIQHPERVKALILLDPAVYTGSGAPGWIEPLLRLPQFQRIGPVLLRGVQKWGIEFGKTAWYDPSRISPRDWDGYTLPLKVVNWDRGLWEFMRARKSLDIETKVKQIQIPVLVITGENDRIVPPEQSIRLAEELPNAQIVVIPQCGHVPQEECPVAVLDAIDKFLQNNDLKPIQ
jgi:pimeloyl-ACP methyl ester carboxylesterase